MTDIIFNVRIGFDWWFPIDLGVKVTRDSNGNKHYFVDNKTGSGWVEYDYNTVKTMIYDIFRPENVQQLDNANPTYEVPPPPPEPEPEPPFHGRLIVVGNFIIMAQCLDGVQHFFFDNIEKTRQQFNIEIDSLLNFGVISDSDRTKLQAMKIYNPCTDAPDPQPEPEPEPEPEPDPYANYGLYAVGALAIVGIILLSLGDKK